MRKRSRTLMLLRLFTLGSERLSAFVYIPLARGDDVEILVMFWKPCIKTETGFHHMCSTVQYSEKHSKNRSLRLSIFDQLL